MFFYLLVKFILSRSRSGYDYSYCKCGKHLIIKLVDGFPHSMNFNYILSTVICLE